MQISQEFIQLNIDLIIIIIVSMICVRLSGNKSMQESTPVEFLFLVFLVSVGWDMVLEDDYTVFHSILSMILVTIFIIFIDWLAFKWKTFRNLTEGQAKIIIKDGEIIHDILKEERISIQEFEARLREQGIFQIKDIEIAYIEINGAISVKQKEDKNNEDIKKAYEDNKDSH